MNLSHGREGNRYEGAGIVQREGRSAPGKDLGLVNAVGAGGVTVHLLQHDQIRPLFVDAAPNAFQIAAYGLGAVGPGTGAAVHEEILRCAEPAVTDVPAQDTQILSGDRPGARAFYVHGFNGFGLIFRNAQKGQQTAQRKDDDQQQDQQDLQQLFHPDPSVSW